MSQSTLIVVLWMLSWPCSIDSVSPGFSVPADKLELCNTDNLYQDPKTCLIVSNYLTTWGNARNFCRFFGGDLVTIENKTDDDLIVEVTQAFTDARNGFWIGLNSLRLPGVFEWSNGQLMNYSHWKTNIPLWNPQTDIGSCVFIDSSQSEWSIGNCSAERGFICLETPLTFNPPGCGPDMVRFRDSCYWTVSGLTGWYSASNWCKTEGGELVDIKDDVENAFLYHFLMKNGGAIWIGLHKSANSRIPTWTRGGNITYTNWDNSPNLDLELCAVIERNGKWMMQPCDSQISWAVCKKLMPSLTTEIGIKEISIQSHDNDEYSQCSDGWTKLGRQCYKAEKSMLSWFDALNYCLSSEGNLASFENYQDEHDFFDSYSIPTNQETSKFWIGLKCNNRSSIMEWNDGSPLLYAQWDPVQISSMKDAAEELCVAHSTQTDRWFCLPCDSGAGFVCTMPAVAEEDVPGLITVRDSTTKTATTIESSPGLWNIGDCNGTDAGELCFQLSNEDDRQSLTTLTDVDPCPEAWDKQGNKCYKVLHDLKDWITARNFCLSFGESDLVAIHSITEQNFLLEILLMHEVKNAWIGLNDVTSEGVFVWSDNSSLNYSNFDPFNARGSVNAHWEDCVMITNVQWQTMECHRKLPYICQKRALTADHNVITDDIKSKSEESSMTDLSIPYTDSEDVFISNNFPLTTTTTILVQEIGPSSILNESTTLVTDLDGQTLNPSTTLDTDFEGQNDTDSDESIITSINSEEEDDINHKTYDDPLEIISPLYSTILPNSADDLNTCKCDLDPGLSGGTIAGIVLGTLILAVLIISMILYAYRKNLTLELMKGKLSFDNALYNPHGDNIQLTEPTEISVRT